MKYEIHTIPLDAAKKMAEFRTTQDIIEWLVDEHDWVVVTEENGAGFQIINPPDQEVDFWAPKPENSAGPESNYWDHLADIAVDILTGDW